MGDVLMGMGLKAMEPETGAPGGHVRHRITLAPGLADPAFASEQWLPWNGLNGVLAADEAVRAAEGTSLADLALFVDELGYDALLAGDAEMEEFFEQVPRLTMDD